MIEPDALMFQKLIEKLRDRGHQVLVTTRDKREANEFYRFLELEHHVVGRYAYTLEEKLLVSAQRIEEMTRLILYTLKGLDAVVSNTSVEACRVGFGLGAEVHTFNDHPAAKHQLLLTIPLSDYVYVPQMIPLTVYRKYALNARMIVYYEGFLTMAWMPYVSVNPHILTRLNLNPDKPIIVFRESETASAYLFGKEDITLPAIKKLSEEMPHIQFVARPRYSYMSLKKYFKDHRNVTIFKEAIDMRSLLALANLLIGGGATMSHEAAWFGTPVITCRPIQAPITDFLIKNDLAEKAQSVNQIIELSKRLMGKRKKVKRAKSIFSKMEFPLETLIENIEAKE